MEVEHQICTICGKAKPKTARFFYKRGDSYRKQCRKCMNEARRASAREFKVRNQVLAKELLANAGPHHMDLVPGECYSGFLVETTISFATPTGEREYLVLRDAWGSRFREDYAGVPFKIRLPLDDDLTVRILHEVSEVGGKCVVSVWDEPGEGWMFLVEPIDDFLELEYQEDPDMLEKIKAFRAERGY